jgi:hypothetical protein
MAVDLLCPTLWSHSALEMIRMATKAQRKIVASKGRTLRYLVSKAPVHVGDEVRSASGEKVMVTGGRAPRSERQIGHVRVKDAHAGELEYFPHVFGLKWSGWPRSR